MALNKSKLDSAIKGPLEVAIKTKLDQYMPIDAEGADPHRQKFCKALAEAVADVVSEQVIKHIIDDMEIIRLVSEIPMGLVSTGVSPSVIVNPAPIPVLQKIEPIYTGHVK